MRAEFMYLGMAVMTACNAVISSSGLDLCVFYSPIFQALGFKSGLKETAAAAAAIIIGSIWLHIYKIFFPYNGFDNKPQIFSNGITKTFPYNLTGVLYCKFYFKVFIPV